MRVFPCALLKTEKLNMTESIQSFTEVSDDKIVIVHHDTQRLAQYEGGPNDNVAPPASILLLYMTTEI